MSEPSTPVWWIEVIKIAPALIAVVFCVVLVTVNRTLVAAALARMTKFKALGIEAEFSAKAMDQAVAAQGVVVSADDRSGALRRLAANAPLLRDARALWVDNHPASTRNERALLEKSGLRITTVATSAEAERELKDHVYLFAITDLDREGRPTEGLDFVARTVADGSDRPTIAYTGTDQWGHSRPPYLFAITNRPDELVHYICDIAQREER